MPFSPFFGEGSAAKIDYRKKIGSPSSDLSTDYLGSYGLRRGLLASRPLARSHFRAHGARMRPEVLGREGWLRCSQDVL